MFLKKQMCLNESLSEDHSSDLVASSLMFLVAVTCESKGVWRQRPQENC